MFCMVHCLFHFDCENSDLNKHNTIMKRMMDDSLITELLKSNLWTNKLHEDCKNQLVFLAIRENKI